MSPSESSQTFQTINCSPRKRLFCQSCNGTTDERWNCGIFCHTLLDSLRSVVQINVEPRPECVCSVVR